MKIESGSADVSIRSQLVPSSVDVSTPLVPAQPATALYVIAKHADESAQET